MSSNNRIESVDLARGIASLIMIQGHAYDGWVAIEYKSSQSYLFTRLLGTLPLPAFLVLSGAAIALRLRSAHGRGELTEEVRNGLVKRGLTVLGWGYLTNFVYAWMDGGRGFDILLRADVLHAIGLSIAFISLFCLTSFGSQKKSDYKKALLEPRCLRRKALWLAFITIAICPFLSQLTQRLEGPVAYAAALLSDVDGITLMPVVPLLAWTAVGMACITFMIPDGRTVPSNSTFLKLACFGYALAAVGHWTTFAVLESLGGVLSRAHLAVIPNAVDGAGRGLFVLGAAAYVGMKFPRRIQVHLMRLGRASLVAYIFHIPFCYGRLAGPLKGSLNMPTATVFVALLMAMSYAAVLVVEKLSAKGK